MQDEVEISLQFPGSHLREEDEFRKLNDYLVSDLNDLYGGPIIFYFSRSTKENFEVGVNFDCPPERFRAVIWRLRNILKRHSLDCSILISWASIKVEIPAVESFEKNDFTALSCVADAADDGILFTPNREYIAEAAIFGETHEEIPSWRNDVVSSLENRHLEFLKDLEPKLPIDNDDSIDADSSKNIDGRKNSIAAMRLKAIGEHKYITDKRSYFDQALVADISKLRLYEENNIFAPRDFSEDFFWPSLQELAENLGLSVSKRRKEYDEKVNAVRKAIWHAKDKIKLELENKRQAEEDRSKRKLYYERLHGIFQKGLFPSEYNQGEIEGLRSLLKLGIGEALRIEKDLKAEMYGSINSSIALDYSRLRALLYQKRWQEADQETERLILSGFSRDAAPLNKDAIKSIKPADLNTIDQLWSRYSNQKFGFKVQLNRYKSLMEQNGGGEKIFSAFKVQLEWENQKPWCLEFWRPKNSYTSLSFSLDAVLGHLPTWRWFCLSLSDDYYVDDSLVEHFLLHLEKELLP